MSSVLTAGLVGTAPAILEVINWQSDGRVITADGKIDGSTLALANVARDQLFGLVNNPDEEWVPVTWTGDTTQNGFYRPLSVTCDHDPVLTDKHFVYFFTLEMERFPGGFAAPDGEIKYGGALRANAHSIVVGDTLPWGATPLAAIAYSNGQTAGDTENTYTAGDGSSIVHRYDARDYLTNRVRFHLPVADWYDASCKLYVNDALIVGRQIANVPSDWLITNEMMRVGPGATPGDLLCEWYDGSNWDPVEFELTYGTGHTALADAPDVITVLRSSPEMVAIRLTYDRSGSWRYQCDLLLRRGARYVEGYIFGDRAQYWGVARTATEASTAVLTTVGIRATSNDGTGNRFFVVCPAANTQDLVNGKIRRTATDQAFSFGIGCAVGGSGATGPMTVDNLTYSYFANSAGRQSVVAK